MSRGHPLRPLAASIALAACLGAFGRGQQANPATPSAVQDDLEVGQHALAARNYKQAVQAFNKANKHAHNKCVVCYLGLAHAYLGLSEAYHAEDDARWAMESCNRALSYAPDDHVRAQAHKCKGEVLQSLPRLDPNTLSLAEHEFRAAMELDKEVPRYHLDLGLTLLRELHEEEGVQEVQTYLALAPNGPDAYLARKLLANPRRARETFAPDFHLTTLQGETLSLEQLAGKVVLLHFWSMACREPTWAYEEHFGQLYPVHPQSWDYPCPDPVSALSALTTQYKPEEFVLISVNEDSNDTALRGFVTKKNMHWLQCADVKGEVFRAFGLQALPAYVAIDRDGVVAFTITGTGDPTPYLRRLSLLPPLSKPE